MRTTIVSLLCILSGAHAFTPSRTTPTSSRRTATFISSTTVASTSEASPEASTPSISSEASTPSIGSSEASTPSTSSEASTPSSTGDKNTPTWEVKQHLYGLDMINEGESAVSTMSVTLDADGQEAGGSGGGDALPLPTTYITCGKCKSLFAISEADLGTTGKGCRVKCSVCSNTWYQSRERLFDIPTETHDMSPAEKSDLNRIARNLARDIPPSFMGVNKLYVGNLDWRTTADELLDFFETYSKKDDGEKVSVCDVSIVIGPDGRSRGFAFVSFYNEADGKAGLECNGLDLNGRELAVREPNN